MNFWKKIEEIKPWDVIEDVYVDTKFDGYNLSLKFVIKNDLRLVS